MSELDKLIRDIRNEYDALPEEDRQDFIECIRESAL